MLRQPRVLDYVQRESSEFTVSHHDVTGQLHLSSDTPGHWEGLNSSKAARFSAHPAKEPDAAQGKLPTGSAPRQLGTVSVPGWGKRLTAPASICQPWSCRAARPERIHRVCYMTRRPAHTRVISECGKRGWGYWGKVRGSLPNQSKEDRKTGDRPHKGPASWIAVPEPAALALTAGTCAVGADEDRPVPFPHWASSSLCFWSFRHSHRPSPFCHEGLHDSWSFWRWQWTEQRDNERKWTM